jgi:DNA polymerase-3 subunit alpha
VKNVGEAAIRSVLEARTRLGRFRSVHEFCENTDLRLANKRVLESLIKAGAFDGLASSRARLFAGVDQLLDSAAKRIRERESGQSNLFGMMMGEEGVAAGDAAAGAGPGIAKDILPDVPDWSERETLGHEKETLGFYITGHPLVPYAEELAQLCTHTTAGLSGASVATGGAEVTVGGIVTTLKRKKTRKGDWMATFNLEDLEGSVEVIVFPDLYGKIMTRLVEDAPVLVTGRAEIEDRPRILSTSLSTLQQARESRLAGVGIAMVTTGLTDETLHELGALLREHKGAVPLYFELTRPGGFVLTLKADPAEFGANPSREFRAAVESLLGKGAVSYRQRAGRNQG